MSDENKTYNGWTNYETWCCALWIDNDQGTQEQAVALARVAREEAPSHSAVRNGIWTVEQGERITLTDALEQWVRDEMIPNLGASFASDMLGAAVSEINFNEIASHFLADLEELEAVEA